MNSVFGCVGNKKKKRNGKMEKNKKQNITARMDKSL